MAKTKPIVIFLASLSFAGVIGCGLDYYGQLVAGELASLGRTVPVSTALDDPNLTEEERAKLALTQDVRQFGIDTVGLNAGDAYTVFEANGTQPAAYVLSASAKDSFTPYTWDLLFVGQSVVKGFFDRDMGQREADQLTDQGYDVYYTTADGFSTLGFLPDPVRQSNLQLEDMELAELILHEMTHSTIFKASDGQFSESLATFVGRTAAQAWFDATYGPSSPQAVAARTRFADKAVIDAYVSELYDTMQQYYSSAAASGTPPDTIIAGRQAQFDAEAARFSTVFTPRLIDPARWAYIAGLEMNNAKIFAAIRYEGSLSDYRAVLDKLGGSFPDAIAVFRDAAAAPDSRAFLRTWLLEH